jgi:hypothetical protein
MALSSAGLVLVGLLFHFIFSFSRQVGRAGWLRRNCALQICIAAFAQHRLRTLLCFEAWQRAAILAARDFAEHKTKPFPIVKEGCHDLRYLHEEPQAPLAGPIARFGPKTAPLALGDGASCLTMAADNRSASKSSEALD